jgi:hypothetical protein
MIEVSIHFGVAAHADVAPARRTSGESPWESDVAKGQLRSNREKKKPKADKNKVKVKAAPTASPFASSRSAVPHPGGKRGETNT